MYSGSCLCGKIQFEIQDELEPIQICHCSQCRKAQGTAFVTNIPVEEVAFKIINGESDLRSFESSPGKERIFCSNCGSPILSKTTKLPGVVRVRAGTLNGDLKTRPIYHIYYGSKANWFEINDDLPKHSERG
ncbi:MAG: GFA family protein [Gammaproteobacteria bacterium]|nr:GFA family protein [Gammaproteobacteria bacterium]